MRGGNAGHWDRGGSLRGNEPSAALYPFPFCAADISPGDRGEEAVKGLEKYSDTCRQKDVLFDSQRGRTLCRWRTRGDARPLEAATLFRALRDALESPLPPLFAARFSAFPRVAVRHKAYSCPAALQCYSLNLFIYEDIVNSRRFARGVTESIGNYRVQGVSKFEVRTRFIRHQTYR